MKLMNLDDEQEEFSIPEMDYACTVRMPSKTFAHTCDNLSQFAEQMVISCTRGGNLTYMITAVCIVCDEMQKYEFYSMQLYFSLNSFYSCKLFRQW